MLTQSNIHSAVHLFPASYLGPGRGGGSLSRGAQVMASRSSGKILR